MSGLAGWIDLRSNLTAERDTITAMADTLRHRGPDGAGTWVGTAAALGYRHLTTPGGVPEDQPVATESSQGVVSGVFTGHVKNVDELRRALRDADRDATLSGDAEVLLASYLHWGSAFVERLNGAFAFSIWDGRHRTALLGRDRLGIRPLYYFPYVGGMLFASEPKAIMVNQHFRARLELTSVPLLLQPRLALPGETPLSGLHEVPAGHVVHFSENGVTPTRYWALQSRIHHESFDDTRRHVRDLLEEIVAEETPAGSPCAATLSGGVDSSTVAALAVRARSPVGPPLETFCVEFPGDRANFSATELRPAIDAPYAKAVAEFIASHHHPVRLDVNNLIASIPATRRARDLPGWGQFDASMYRMFEEIRRHSTVAMTGEAADEVFGGYPYLFKDDVLARDDFPWLGDGPKLSDYLSAEVRAVIDPEEDERARYQQLRSTVPYLAGEDPAEARVREALFLGMCGPLSVILDRMERMSMAAGVDVRFPFCDHRLVEYVWNVPWSMKSRGGTKGLLKAAVSDAVPKATLERKKSAYPHVQNPDYEKALVARARTMIEDQESATARMFDRSRMLQLIDQLESVSYGWSLPGGASGPQLLIQLIEMDAWMEHYEVAAG